MTARAPFTSRPWTLADDDKLRTLAVAGLSLTAISVRMGRTETVIRSRAERLRIVLRKIRRKQLQMG
jgi:hypothetical protein